MAALGAEEIYNLYLDILDRGRISEKGGAGLGILRVMKDSGQNVEYDFVVDETQRTFFSMEIKIIG